MIIKFQTRTALWWMLFAFLFCAASRSLDAQTNEKLTASGTTMGVVSYSVIAYGEPDIQAEFESAIAEELEAVNQRMSTYIDDSEVSRFNQSTSTDWVAVSKETAAVVQRAQEISELSAGAFDITVQPLVALWSFSKNKPETFELPGEQVIAAELEKVGYKKLRVSLDPPALRKSIPALQIDLSAIAKGYAVDQVAGRLNAFGLDNYLIEVGGEVRAAGEKPDKMGWKVGIEKPIPGVREPYRVIDLYHKSLASSGDYRNFFEHEGKRYSHTIDPRTGYPVNHAVTASSVIAADCATADAVATAIMVLGKDQGIQLAEKAGVQALVLERSGEQLVATQTSSFPREPIIAKSSNDTSIFRMIGVASVFFLLAVLAMAIGVIFGRERIKGSCGGIAALDNPDIAPECSLCSRAAECDDLKKEMKKRQAPAE